jgi:tRNA threonylcarbamoyladenosine biosynthesis protein TsaB
MIDAPLILSLETATLGGSVWLGRGKLQLATRNGDPLVSQSNSLLSDIHNCLEEAGLSLPEVAVLACASGPGSFTGLRIGIATLKGLAATLDRPCVGIPTLQAVAHAAGPSRATVSLLPAGRGEVFAQMFSVSSVAGEDLVEAIDTSAHLSPQKLIERYGTFADLRWAGSGAHLQREAIENGALARGISFAEISPAAPSTTPARGWELAALETNLAKHVAALALAAFQTGRIQSPSSLSAIYVRPSDAELNERCR